MSTPRRFRLEVPLQQNDYMQNNYDVHTFEGQMKLRRFAEKIYADQREMYESRGSESVIGKSNGIHLAKLKVRSREEAESFVQHDVEHYRSGGSLRAVYFWEDESKPSPKGLILCYRDYIG